jgi:peptidoglycan L-alanyl-D-glutamate endopeptidase CwlK
MTFSFSQRSLDNLKGVHPDLVKVMTLSLAWSPYDYAIIQGCRTQAEEDDLVAKGLSQTKNSKHLTGRAVDFFIYVGGKGTWESTYYIEVANAIKTIAGELHIPII